MTVIIRQRAAASLEDVAGQLQDAFTASRAAIGTAESVVLIANAPDLLGQASVQDAAVACGLLGLMRALVFEGGAKGWHVNLVAVDRDAEPAADVLLAASSIMQLNGQVLNSSAAQLGKLIP